MQVCQNIVHAKRICNLHSLDIYIRTYICIQFLYSYFIVVYLNNAIGQLYN